MQVSEPPQRLFTLEKVGEIGDEVVAEVGAIVEVGDCE